MPLYTFECEKCESRTEEVFKMDDRPAFIGCECGAQAVRIINVGGIQSDSPGWLTDQVRACIQNPMELATRRERPIETRSAYKEHIKKHNIIPCG